MKPTTRLSLLAAIVAGAAALVLSVTYLTRLLDNWIVLVVLVVAAGLAVLVTRGMRKRIAPGTALEIDLDRGVVEDVGSDPISRATRRGAVVLRDVVEALHRAGDDDRISGVVMRLGNSKIGLAQAQEIRDAVKKFRASEKPAIAFAESFGEGSNATVDYYLAAAFDEIYLQPGGELMTTGLLARANFIRGVLDKAGIEPQFDHRKEYKAAMYRLTERSFNEPYREMVSELTGDQFAQIIAGIAADRNMSESDVKDLIDDAPHMGLRALESGLVDQRGYRDDAYQATGADQFLFHDAYLRKAGRPHAKGKSVALISGVGAIHRGSSRFDPLTGGPSFGADDVAAAFRSAIDDGVSGIIFRVDSPGGSAVASEVVRHEVARAVAAEIPVVVSMGDVAGSGGYWVSASATHVVAQPGTITGSIGVVSGKMVTADAWAKVGVTFDQLGFGENSSFTSSAQGYSAAERTKLDAQLDRIYDEFIDLVASSRDLSPERVEEIARGRVWTGAQGLELGLVDSLGGLDEALDQIRSAAGLTEVSLVPYPKSGPLSFLSRKDSSEVSSEAIGAVVTALRGTSASLSGAQLLTTGYRGFLD